MKITTLTAILVIGLLPLNFSLAKDSTYLEERSAQLHQAVSEQSGNVRTSEVRSTQRTAQPDKRQSVRHGPSAGNQDRWWK